MIELLCAAVTAGDLLVGLSITVVPLLLWKLDNCSQSMLGQMLWLDSKGSMSLKAAGLSRGFRTRAV